MNRELLYSLLNKRKRTYAGIGARDTPDNILQIMGYLALALQDNGWMLRSGGARGADQAFAEGLHVNNTIIYTASDATEAAMQHAKDFHPAWHNCSDYAKRLHARNSMIILGRDLHSPVDLVVCWTKDAEIVGGTGQSLRVAQHHSIPIVNLGHPTLKRWIVDYVDC